MVGVEGRASELQNAGSVGRIRVDRCGSGQVRAPYSRLQGRGYGGSRIQVLGGRIRVDRCGSGQVRAPYSRLKGRGYGGSRMEVLGAGLGLTGVVLVRSELRIRGYREGVMVGPESRFWGAGLGLTDVVLARLELRIRG